jgi:hypothetical protein
MVLLNRSGVGQWAASRLCPQRQQRPMQQYPGNGPTVPRAQGIGCAAVHAVQRCGPAYQLQLPRYQPTAIINYIYISGTHRTASGRHTAQHSVARAAVYHRCNCCNTATSRADTSYSLTLALAQYCAAAHAALLNFMHVCQAGCTAKVCCVK